MCFSMLFNDSTWQRIEDLDLRGNHWQCDCHNLWMLNTLVPSIEVLEMRCSLAHFDTVEVGILNLASATL